MSYPILADRFTIVINSIGYLSQSGFIQSSNFSSAYNSKLAQGMSASGTASGIVMGNESGHFGWVEYLPALSEYINWKVLLKANPNAVIQFIPFNISGSQSLNLPSFTATGIAVTGGDVTASMEGTAITRSLSFVCASISNL